MENKFKTKFIFCCFVARLECSCPVDDKLISRFRGSWSDSSGYETQVYAYMKTFRFTGSPALYIECDVRMCHGRCPVSYKCSHNLLFTHNFIAIVQTNDSFSHFETIQMNK